MDDGPRILDCLEFDDELRFGDVLNDVAFLAMDLGRLGHPELGERFLAEYRRLSGARWPDSLARHYMAYRAHVRAKVACLRDARGGTAAASSARSLHATAVRHLESARLRLVLVGGLPGTGKTTVSRPLAERLGAHRVSSDEVRDELFPRGAATETDRYRPESVDRVYTEMLRRAELSLGLGEHVVLDASWLHERHRSAARGLAERAGAALVELRCACPAEVARHRIERRARTGTDASEATVEVAQALAGSADPWPAVHRIDTDAPVTEAVTTALVRIDERIRS
jgi:predicted kinase